MRQLEHKEIVNKKPQKEIVVVCDRISDKRNVGMIFRVAEAFGVKRIYFSKELTPTISEKIRRISRSTTESIAHYFYNSEFELIELLKNADFKIVGLEKCDESVALDEFNSYDLNKVALIIGSENSGVSQDLLDFSDEVVHIPMYGKNSSFNVVNALSITLYQLREENY